MKVLLKLKVVKKANKHNSLFNGKKAERDNVVINKRASKRFLRVKDQKIFINTGVVLMWEARPCDQRTF